MILRLVVFLQALLLVQGFQVSGFRCSPMLTKQRNRVFHSCEVTNPSLYTLKNQHAKRATAHRPARPDALKRPRSVLVSLQMDRSRESDPDPNEAAFMEAERLEKEVIRLENSRGVMGKGLKRSIRREVKGMVSGKSMQRDVRNNLKSRRSTSTLFLVEELTTDDGLTLSGSELLAARSNWIRF